MKLEELKWVTPVGVQWTCRAPGEEDWEAMRDAWTKKLQARWPEAEIRRVTGSWRTLRIEAKDMGALRKAIARARESGNWGQWLTTERRYW